MHGRKSIVARMTTWYVSSLFVIVLCLTAYLYWTLFSAIRSENRAVLLDRIQTVSSLVARGRDALEYAKDRINLEWPSRHFERVYVRVTRESGEVLLQSPALPEEVPALVFAATAPVSPEGTKILPLAVSTAGGGSYIAAATRVHTGFAGPVMIYVALDLRRQSELLSRYRAHIAVALAISLLFSALFGRRLAISAFRPVENIVSTTRRIRSSTLNERVEEAGLPEELERLASTVNEMLDRLEDSFARLSRFSSDIAHELRTPINNIRGEAEVALSKARTVDEYREVLSSCLEESARVARIIDSLLFLAKTEQPAMQIRKERVRLRSELLNLRDFYEASAAEDGISIDISVPEDLEILVERTLFQRALGNLIANGISYNRPGGSIRIQAEPRAGRVEISVIDTGQGISAADLPHVFDRFYRVDPARKASKLGGFGLGLTMVKSIVQLHQGDIRIESEMGKGTRVLLSIPS